MAHFRGTVQGSRGEASRLGSKSSGMDVVLNGWAVGVHVEAAHEDGKDVIRVFKTKGPYTYDKELIAEIVEGAESED